MAEPGCSEKTIADEFMLFLKYNHDLRSKLIDGLLSAVILCLMWLFVALSDPPGRSAIWPAGLLIYMLG